jgi:hypothetical protein
MVVIVAAHKWGASCKPRKYCVHKDVITNASPYFMRVFDGQFKEAETKDLWLEDQDIAVIDLLLQWVYGGGGVREPGDEDRCDDVYSLLQLYVLANKICTERLMNDVMDILKEYFFDYNILEDMVIYTFKGTSEQSPMRKLLTIAAVESAVADPAAVDWVEEALKGHGGFAVDFARRFALQSRPGAKKLSER